MAVCGRRGNQLLDGPKHPETCPCKAAGRGARSCPILPDLHCRFWLSYIKAALRAAAPLRVSSLRCGPLRDAYVNGDSRMKTSTLLIRVELAPDHQRAHVVKQVEVRSNRFCFLFRLSTFAQR